MNKRLWRADSLLLLTAAIWGFAFVAQRVGMDYVGPFTYNAARFALGSLSLLPLIFLRPKDASGKLFRTPMKTLFSGGGIIGLFLFSAVSLQQVGLKYTTAGKAGFITGLYVVFVPIIGLFWGHRLELNIWIGASMAAAGMYLLSVSEQFTIQYGDLLVLIGAFLWTGHVLFVGWFARKMEAIELAFFQFMVCCILSFLTAAIFETIALQAIWQAAIPIAYGGILSGGVAYTLQVVAQRDAHPAHAAIIMSLESVFAALGGWMFLGEHLAARGIAGCVLMLVGMVCSQVKLSRSLQE